MSQNLTSDEKLPFSVEAERAVLGGIMFKNDAWDLVAGLVLEEDFYQYEHKLIFKTIKNLQDSGKPIDFVTVIETLEGNGDLPELDNLGGKNYIQLLGEETPTIANIESYAEIIKQRSNLRRLITTVDQIAQNAREADSSSSDQIIDNALTTGKDGSIGSAYEFGSNKYLKLSNTTTTTRAHARQRICHLCTSIATRRTLTAHSGSTVPDE